MMTHPLTEDQRRMAAENIWLVFAFISRNRRRIPLGWDVEDFEGELLKSLCRAVQFYDPSIGAFSTYLYRCMERQQIRMFRHWHALMRQRTRTQSLGDKRSANMRDDADGPNEIAERNDDIKYLRILINELPERWRQIMLERAEGKTLEEIGKRRGITRERVRQMEANAVERMRKMARTGL